MPVSSGGTGTPTFKTRAQAIAYYAGKLQSLKGTYQGTYKQYDGTSWKNLYLDLAKTNPSADPEQLAGVVVEIEGAQRLGVGLQAAETELGKYLATTKKALAETNFAAGVPDPLAGLLAPLSELAAVFSAVYHQLTKVSMWRSLGWVLLGIIVLALGIIWWAKNEALPVAKEVASHVL